ncbi:MAG: hypothetical protein RLY16_1560 [Bacteroidota bacterium]
MTKILDCTIRDGGYYNNWDFNSDLMNDYVHAINDLPIEYFEIGYRANAQKGYFGKYFYTPEHELQKISAITNKKIAIMLNQKDTSIADLDKLLSPCKNLVQLVRIAFDPGKILEAITLATAIKNMGFEVGFNMMYMSKWKSNETVFESLKLAEGVVDYVYMVDSYGGVFPNDIIETLKKLKQSINVPIGFHGHNNLELALINTLTAIEHGVDIVDATFTGMGRGAGNLKTELLLAVLNQQKGLPVDFNRLGLIVDQFSNLQKEYGWGTNLPYMISGVNALPQKDVMEWVTKRFYSFNSIIRALQNKKNDQLDNQQLEVLQANTSFEKAIIIGGGPNAALHAESVQHYIIAQENCCLIHASSKNAAAYNHLSVPAYFCLVGNEGHRLEAVFQQMNQFDGICVLPPYPRKMGTYIPGAVKENSFELPAVTFTKLVDDSHTVLALQTAIQLGAKSIELVGYDGYQEGAITQLEKSLSDENEAIFSDFVAATGINLIAITNTNYKGLKVESVYSKII